MCHPSGAVGAQTAGALIDCTIGGGTKLSESILCQVAGNALNLSGSRPVALVAHCDCGVRHQAKAGRNNAHACDKFLCKKIGATSC